MTDTSNRRPPTQFTTKTPRAPRIHEGGFLPLPRNKRRELRRPVMDSLFSQKFSAAARVGGGQGVSTLPKVDARCWITAVQNKSTGDLADLKIQGLWVGFWLSRGESPRYEMMISRIRVTATAISGQRQKTAAGNSDSGRGAVTRFSGGGMATSGSFNRRSSLRAADVKGKQGAGHP